jgi:hypothetical protein
MKPSDLFRELADKIDRNPPEDFGGAFLVIPPTGDPITGLIVSSNDLETFFGLVKTKLDVAVDRINEAQRMQPGFRGR